MLQNRKKHYPGVIVTGEGCGRPPTRDNPPSAHRPEQLAPGQPTRALDGGVGRKHPDWQVSVRPAMPEYCRCAPAGFRGLTPSSLGQSPTVLAAKGSPSR
ncbi:hypothetical protein GCM10027280_28030 [Micromonospora polyrhachis]